MKIILFTAGLSLLLFTACDSSAPEEKYIPKADTGAVKNTAAPVTLNNPLQNQPPATIMQQGQLNPQQMQVPAPVNNMTVNPTIPTIKPAISAPNQTQNITAATATPPGMNPPHGQPNHRCDIAVGAPLNSKPVASPSVTQQPGQTVITQQPVKPTAPGMNPPHGQPNHRCDIAVGAPLNSKPVPSPTISQQPVQTIVTQQPIKPTDAPKKDTGQ